MNQYYIEFFELIPMLQNTTNSTIQQIQKILLKLNNPTYYNRFIITNPINKFGFNSTIIKNPVLLAIRNMLFIISSNTKDIIKKLQIEISWAFNNYSFFSKL